MIVLGLENCDDKSLSLTFFFRDDELQKISDNKNYGDDEDVLCELSD